MGDGGSIMRLLVTGSRDYTNVAKVVEVLMYYDPSSTTIIHGGAKGLDTIADIVGRELGFTIEPYKAGWEHSNRDGVLRNSQMLHEGKPDKVIGFRSKINSKGTNDMLLKAGKAGIDHEIHDDFIL